MSFKPLIVVFSRMSYQFVGIRIQPAPLRYLRVETALKLAHNEGSSWFLNANFIKPIRGKLLRHLSCDLIWRSAISQVVCGIVCSLMTP